MYNTISYSFISLLIKTSYLSPIEFAFLQAKPHWGEKKLQNVGLEKPQKLNKKTKVSENSSRK